jgi:dTDP-4-amino-4,6-dideoxygalactose transaminase
VKTIPAAKPIIGDDERRAVDRVLQSGLLAQGPEVAAFEQEFSDELLGGRRCVAVNSGTAGLHLGLVAAGIGPGDEVVVPSFTFAATANAVRLVGATPIFADIDPATFCVTPASVADVLTDRSAGVMPVHLYGHPADMPGFVELCGSRGLALFEDAAQAHGATVDGVPVGTFGTFAMFSLYPTKNMTSGEGGMVAADDEVLRLLRLLRNQGMERRYENEVVGFNARMTDVHAAIGRVQLQKLADWTDRRRAIAAVYDDQLHGVVTPPVAGNVRHVYHQYTIRVAGDRDAFARTLREEHAIETGVYYPTPVHRLPSFDETADLPETFAAADEVLSLPVHPSLSDEDVERIVEAVNTVARAGS